MAEIAYCRCMRIWRPDALSFPIIFLSLWKNHPYVKPLNMNNDSLFTGMLVFFSRAFQITWSLCFSVVLKFKGPPNEQYSSTRFQLNIPPPVKPQNNHPTNTLIGHPQILDSSLSKNHQRDPLFLQACENDQNSGLPDDGDTKTPSIWIFEASLR